MLTRLLSGPGGLVLMGACIPAALIGLVLVVFGEGMMAGLGTSILLGAALMAIAAVLMGLLDLWINRR